MKIATITCHDVYNYGASLQAYALQHYLEICGHQYNIIDYRPDYLSNHYNLNSVANPLYDRPIIKQLYLLAKLPGRLRGLKRKKRFDRFKDSFLHLTDYRYTTSEEIAANRPDADIYIAGSDQIWNTLFRNGRDNAFYLDFAVGHGKLISYAASFATDRIHTGMDRQVSKWLSHFDNISVRESSALDLLTNLGRKDGILVCDPVFLLGKDSWIKLAAQAEYGTGMADYIFLYDCEQSNKLKTIAKNLREKTGYKILSVSETKGHYADVYLDLSGPLEFLNLITNARYVVANSFHALAFSLIFEKDFFIVNRSENINTRMYDFLNYLGLNHKLIDTPQQLSLQNIDYTDVSYRLAKLIEKSKHFLAEHTRI